jgi:hypothetical protein
LEKKVILKSPSSPSVFTLYERPCSSYLVEFVWVLADGEGKPGEGGEARGSWVTPSLGIPDKSENTSQIYLGYILGYILDIS